MPWAGILILQDQMEKVQEIKCVFGRQVWKMYRNIMFDLDGIVTDFGRAIMSSVEYA